ncbi:110aa long hypothetical protein [Pyrococcus horikoshii OT3]|uniref:Uncharacterized protein n=1 Tax=Pyrococcus horikoshii (strain ATCC 700860 / DSM 12428 / JCM 9974 / NBRC 100139 / OT-3) TaxID=70601 RepID=O58002_PYRHO|nr:110aa long hypothetical protein [Pyrococcus horikoshii OT3]
MFGLTPFLALGSGALKVSTLSKGKLLKISSNFSALSYSPVPPKSGEIAGILINSIKVETISSLRESISLATLSRTSMLTTKDNFPYTFKGIFHIKKEEEKANLQFPSPLS